MRELLSSFDQPLKIARDQMVGKDRLRCAYNRVVDSYRSTWSNQYEPILDGGAMLIERVRKVGSTITEKCILRAVCLRFIFKGGSEDRSDDKRFEDRQEVCEADT